MLHNLQSPLLLRAVQNQSSKLLSRPLQVETVKLNSQLILAQKPAFEEKPVVFLHGIFGSSSTFKCYAQHHKIQQKRSRSYLVDLRNHGRSGNHQSMNIYDQVEDLHEFLQDNGINEKVTLVGHSLGGKVAMAYSLIYPEKVEALCSIDSPPVDRNDFPQLNGKTLGLIEQACSYLPGIEERSLKEAWSWLKSKREENKLLVSSLMMNLDKASINQARLLINVRGLAAQSSNIFDFPIFEDSSVNTRLGPENLLFINGANSMQISVQNDIQFYSHVFENASDENLHILQNCGHHVHHEKKDKCVDIISSWLGNNNKL